jgi:hypothetical protein
MPGLCTSSAYEAFEESKREIHILLEASRDQSTLSRRKTNTGNRAATVVLCSHLEGYVEGVFLEGWDVVERCGILVERLPPGLRREVFVVEGRKVIDARHGPDFEDIVERFFASWGHLLESGTPFDMRKSRAECLVDRLNVPSAENICDLFRTYGIHDIFQRIELITNGRWRSEDLKLAIGDLVNKRHGIAHGDTAVVPTTEDVARYAETVKVICRHIDVVLGYCIEGLTGSFPWTGKPRNADIAPQGGFPDWWL